MMLTRLLLMTILCVVIKAWVLKVSDNVIARKFSSNVTLECRYDGNDNNVSQLSEVYRLRILKLNKATTKWDTVAKISALHSAIQTSLLDADITGKATTIYKSFLKIKFSSATAETVGEFKCIIDGYDQNEDLQSVQTNTVTISERGINYDDILEIVMNVKDVESKDHANDVLAIVLLNKTLTAIKKREDTIGKLISQNTNGISTVNDQLEKMKADILGQHKQTIEDTRAMVQNDPSKIWPAGTYSIPQPDTGCPHSPAFDWASGYFRITTKAGVNSNDDTSAPVHLYGNVLQHASETSYNYVQLTSCVKTNKVGPTWPKGRYCIQALEGGSEVAGFQFGTITFGRYNTNDYDRVEYTWSSRTAEFTSIGFWCRKDGNAADPIDLPSKDPIYLFRYGGACQMVKNMDVSNEWVYFDTLRTKDNYSNSFHPDGSIINGIRLDLCYYTPK